MTLVFVAAMWPTRSHNNIFDYYGSLNNFPVRSRPCVALWPFRPPFTSPVLDSHMPNIGSLFPYPLNVLSLAQDSQTVFPSDFLGGNSLIRSFADSLPPHQNSSNSFNAHDHIREILSTPRSLDITVKQSSATYSENNTTQQSCSGETVTAQASDTSIPVSVDLEAEDPCGDCGQVSKEKLKDLEAFALMFKSRRIKLGYTQTNVGKL